MKYTNAYSLIYNSDSIYKLLYYIGENITELSIL